MGEYASYAGQRVKIGTCENMYYLRADQRHRVGALSGNVDPVKDAPEIRFRFPFPDEDHVEPGAFDRYDRTVGLHGIEVPTEVEHGTVQFVAPGYNVCLPCPESAAGKASGLRIHRNGHPGTVQISQQRRVNQQWVLIARCGGCDYPYRYPTLAEVEPVLVCLRSYADREPEGSSARAFYHAMADRILAGYAGTS
jgi:hypothetical protein